MDSNDEKAGEENIKSEEPLQQGEEIIRSEPASSADEKETLCESERSQLQAEESDHSEAVATAIQNERQRLTTWTKEYLTVLKKKIEDGLYSFERTLENHSRSGGSILDGCPGGDISDGICPPTGYRFAWMSVMHGGFPVRIADAILPGTHDSGMDKKAAHPTSPETCQDREVAVQLNCGIRVFDIRVEYYYGMQNTPREFMIYHLNTNGRTVAPDFLDAINSFRAYNDGQGNTKKEIIILDFHQFKNFNEDAHRRLAELIKNRLHTSVIIPRWMNPLSIEQVWEYGELGVVVAYNEGNQSLRDPLFWNGVKQKWIGKDQVLTSELKQYMDQVAREQKPFEELRSIQCAKYAFTFNPDDISDSIRQWFYSDTYESSYIQKFYIINTDWSLRQRLVDNCRHANGIKIEWLKQHDSFYSHTELITQNPEGTYRVSSAFRFLRVRIDDGHWAKELSLSSPTQSNPDACITITSNAAFASKLMLTGTDIPHASLPLIAGDTIALRVRSDSSRLWWELIGPDYLAVQNDSNIPTPGIFEKFIRYRLADAHFASELYLPSQAPDASVIHVSSTATLTATIKKDCLMGDKDVSVPKGFSGLFVFHTSTRCWEQLE